eukprot:7015050-Prymnesium_polylepis.2
MPPLSATALRALLWVAVGKHARMTDVYVMTLHTRPHPHVSEAQPSPPTPSNPPLPSLLSAAGEPPPSLDGARPGWGAHLGGCASRCICMSNANASSPMPPRALITASRPFPRTRSRLRRPRAACSESSSPRRAPRWRQAEMAALNAATLGATPCASMRSSSCSASSTRPALLHAEIAAE